MRSLSSFSYFHVEIFLHSYSISVLKKNIFQFPSKQCSSNLTSLPDQTILWKVDYDTLVCITSNDVGHFCVIIPNVPVRVQARSLC